MKTKCGWPHCTAESNQPYTDGWANCSSDGDIPFLPEVAFFCPKHAEMFEQVIRDPSLFNPDEPPKVNENVH